MGEFQKALPNEWGWVDTGREIVDTDSGAVFRVDNQIVAVFLKSQDGQSMRYEPFDRIDHKRFKLRD